MSGKNVGRVLVRMFTLLIGGNSSDYFLSFLNENFFNNEYAFLMRWK